MGRGAKPPASRNYAKAELHDDSEAHSRLTLNTRQVVRTLSNATWSSGAIRRRGGRHGSWVIRMTVRPCMAARREPMSRCAVAASRYCVGSGEDEAACLSGRQAGAIPTR